jgi:membrane protein DedA with SNARE-associated domain
VEQFIHNLVQIDPAWVYVFVGSIAFIENIFPPFPSDVGVVAVGSLTGLGSVNFAMALLCSTAGSTVGFVIMFKVGNWFGRKVIEQGRIKFLPLDQLHKVEGWFQKYGYLVVVGNRFLSGTRAVVSVFAGISELSLLWCTILSFFSALTWNFILLYSGKLLGNNWKDISIFLEAYGKAATSILIVLALIFLGRYIYRRQTKPGSASTPPPKPPVS